MKPDELLQIVREALRDIEEHISQGTFNQGREGFPTSAELSVIKEELQRVESELVNAKIPEKDQRRLGIGRIVLDGWWKYDKEPLATKLMAITDTYKRKLPSSVNAPEAPEAL